MDMDVKVSRDGGKLIFKVDGRLDSNTAPQLLKVIKSEIDDAEQAVYDFENLMYISSAGIRVVVQTMKALGTENVKIINANDEIEGVFALVGLNGVI